MIKIAGGSLYPANALCAGTRRGLDNALRYTRERTEKASCGNRSRFERR